MPSLNRSQASMKSLCAVIALILSFAGCAGSAPDLKKTQVDNAVKENPQDANAHHELGKISFAEGRYAKAIEHLEQSVELDPTNMEVYALLVAAHNRMGNYGRVIEILRRPELSNHPETRFSLGIANIGQGNVVGGKESLIKAIADKPELARVFYTAIGENAPADSPPLSAMEKAMADVLDRIMEDMRREILEDIREDIRESVLLDK